MERTEKMTEPRRQIVVPIDYRGLPRPAVELLIRIAIQLDRELLGRLSSDTHLHRVADLPFTTEISLSGGRELALQRHAVARRQQRIIDTARRLLEELAQQREVGLSFEQDLGQGPLENDGLRDVFLPSRRQGSLQGPSRRRNVAVERLGLLLPGNNGDTQVINIGLALARSGMVGAIYLLGDAPTCRNAMAALAELPLSMLHLQQPIRCGDADTLLATIARTRLDLLVMPRHCLADIPRARLQSALESSRSQLLLTAS
jgi:hypothetical protein